MNIIVCIKQVPGTNKVKMDEKTGVLKREGVESKMNPYDLYAIETALKIKEKTGGTVKAITMGPLQAESVIKEAFMMGVDEGYIFSDRRFAGSDTLATAYTLSQGIRLIEEFDIIICGKQTTDGDTSQVGPSLAEYLNIPHVTWVSKIHEIDEKRIIVEQDMTDTIEIVELKYPCLITVEKGIFQPRLPSYKKKLAMGEKEIKRFTLEDFCDRDEFKYGLKGSATKVEKIFPPEVNTSNEIFEGDAKELAGRIFEILKKDRFV